MTKDCPRRSRLIVGSVGVIVSLLFVGSQIKPPLRLVASDRIGEDVIRLAYVPA